jgi:hypothetical protein
MVNKDGINDMGDVPTGSLLQVHWATGGETGNRRVVPWSVINKFVGDNAKGAAKDNATSSGEDNTKGAAKVNATSSGEEKTSIKAKKSNNKTSSKAKSAKLTKLVEMAKSTDFWCLTLFVPSSQEAKAKQRKVCPVNLRGEVCTANNCGNKHPKVCIVANHSKGKIPKATCALWHMRVPFWAEQPRETSLGGGAAPTLPAAARGATAHGSTSNIIKKIIILQEYDIRRVF